MPGGWKLHGWDLKPGVPSTPYLAAAHWLEQALLTAAKDQEARACFLDFHAKAHRLAGAYGKWSSQLKCVEEAQAKIIGFGVERWSKLDGDLFFETSLDNENISGDRPTPKAVYVNKHTACRVFSPTFFLAATRT